MTNAEKRVWKSHRAYIRLLRLLEKPTRVGRKKK